MRHKGKYLKLTASVYPRGFCDEGALRDHAKKMRRLRYRLARKNAVLTKLSLWWNSEDEEGPEDPDEAFNQIDSALGV